MKHIFFDLETTGLNASIGNKITCICAIDSDGNRFSCVEPQEELIVKSFLKWLSNYSPDEFAFVSANGVGFDIPFILIRSLFFLEPLTKSELNALLNRKHFDIMTITSRFVSLDNLATLFKCKRKTGKGSDAIVLYQENKLKELAEYCMNDVEVTKDIFYTFESMQEKS
jgi:uncharacterized protein YprB with RNaseH-like and TPR domain